MLYEACYKMMLSEENAMSLWGKDSRESYLSLLRTLSCVLLDDFLLYPFSAMNWVLNMNFKKGFINFLCSSVNGGSWKDFFIVPGRFSQEVWSLLDNTREASPISGWPHSSQRVTLREWSSLSPEQRHQERGQDLTRYHWWHRHAFFCVNLNSWDSQ